LFSACSVLSQTKNKNTKDAHFDSIYYELAVNLSSSNPKRALIVADSLFSNAVIPNHQFKALMLSADIYSSRGQKIKAMDYALRAMALARKEKNYSSQAICYGFLSGICKD